MQLSPWSQLYLSVCPAPLLRNIGIPRRNLPLRLHRHKNLLQLSLGNTPELIQRHWRNESQAALAVPVHLIEFHRHNHRGALIPRDIAYAVILQDSIRILEGTLRNPRIEIIEILDIAPAGKCNSQCVHCVVPMVIALGPVFDFRDSAPI